MLKTEIGTQRLNDMINAKHSINIRFEDSSLEGKCGEAITYTSVDRETGEIDFESVTIVLFEEEINSISEYDKRHKTNFSKEEKLGAIATHEARHATDKRANVNFEPDINKREDLASKDEDQYIHELLEKKTK